jgi:ABC-2 type transport system ATP-binding protein
MRRQQKSHTRHHDDVAVRVDHLTKRFGNVTAVDDLSFTVNTSTVVGFLGPNGAGKSTTLRMLLGLMRPTNGQAAILSRPYRELSDPLRSVGALLDPQVFHSGRSGRDALRITAIAAGIPLSRVDEVLALVGLSKAARRKVGGYSTGMRQRLGLANALLGDPQLLVLDEPANGLDPEGMRWLRDLLRSLADEGRTVLVSSHVLAEVAQLADEVIIITRGRLVTKGPLAQLQAKGEGRVTARSPQAADLVTLLRKQGEAAWLGWAGEVLVDSAPAAVVGELANAARITLHELKTDGPSLEDLFLELTDNSKTSAGTSVLDKEATR